MAFAGTVAPTGWLLADGAAVSRTTYAALFGGSGSITAAGDFMTLQILVTPEIPYGAIIKI